MTIHNSECTILLVEDNPNDVFLLKRAWRKAMLANPIQVVASGEQAIAYLQGDAPYDDRDAHPLPAIVLLDLKLPGISGLDVLRWLRGQSALRRIPVVMLTSSSEAPDINRAYDLGANSYLLKPGSQDELIRVVSQIGLYWLVLNRAAEPCP